MAEPAVGDVVIITECCDPGCDHCDYCDTIVGMTATLKYEHDMEDDEEDQLEYPYTVILDPPAMLSGQRITDVQVWEVEPAIKPPKFTTVSEADTWLKEHTCQT